MSAEIIQDSIYAFAFDLKHNEVAKDFQKPPAVVLLSLLKKGHPYSSKTSDKYLPPQQEAMKKFLEMKSNEHTKQIELENKIKKIAYNDWISGLSEEELLSLVDGMSFDNFPEKIQKTIKRKKALELSIDYFDTEIWPLTRENLLIESELGKGIK